MTVIEVVLAACTFLAPQEDTRVEISPAVAAGKVAAAIKAGPAPAIEAIKAHGVIADPIVTKAVGKALRSRDVDVRMAAVKALRFNEDDSAVSELLKVGKAKNVAGSAEVGPEYFLALGQHGSLKAFPVLGASFKSGRRRGPALRARVLALGKMRSRSSISLLITNRVLLVRLRVSGEVRMSLAALSGRDPGKDSRAWGEWWEGARRGFKISPNEKPLPRELARAWGRVWNDPASQGEKKSRGRQGDERTGGDDDRSRKKARKSKKKERGPGRV